MPDRLEFFERMEIMRNSLSKGDFDLLVRAIRDPHLLTPEEAGKVGDSMGMAPSWKKWVTNLATDPTVWIAGLLAAKYPVGLWSWGIPKRLVASGAEFGGLSKIFRPVINAFRGTGMDERIALGMYRQAHVNIMAQPTFRALSALSKTEKIALTRFREEGITDGMTKLAHEADEHMTHFFRRMWGKLSQTADVQGSTATGELSYGGFARRTRGGGLAEDPRVPLNFRNMVPHIPILSTDGTMTVSGSEALARMHQRGGRAMEQALKADGFGPTRRVPKIMPDGSQHPTEKVVMKLGPWSVDSTDQVQSSLAQFNAMINGNTGKMFFGHLKHRVRDLPIHGAGGKGLFIADMDQIFANYVRGASRTYAWNSPLSAYERKIGSFLVENPNPKIKVGRHFQDRMIHQELSAEPLMIQIQRAGLESMGVKVKTSVVKGTEAWNVPRTQLRFDTGDTPAKLQALDHLIGSLKGTMNDKDIILGNLFSKVAVQVENATKAVSPAIARKVSTHFEYWKSTASDRSKNNFLASYSYYTTLGLNPSPVMGNALQTPLTTLPSLPIGAVFGGIGDFLGRIPAYVSKTAQNYRAAGRKGRKSLVQASRDSFNEVFHELADYKIDVDPRLFDIDEGALVDGAFRDPKRYMDWMLGPFKAVETANRGIAFYSAKRAGVAAMKANPHMFPPGLSASELQGYIDLHSARTVHATQFLPGGGSRTIAQDSVAPWLRTFSSFPLRFFSWLGESTVRGAMTEAEMKHASLFERLTGGRNFGVLARAYITGRVLEEGFSETLGIDVNRWAGFGPADANQDLAILPIPPIAGAFFSTIKALSTGEIDDVQPMTVPGLGKMPVPRTLIPGGVALNRLGRAIEQFDNDTGGFVDEDSRLRRRAGVDEQIFSALGIPTNKARRERIENSRLKVRVQKVRDFRRRYGAMIMQGNLAAAAKVGSDYQEAFPDMAPLSLDISDLNVMRENGRIPRLAHRLRSLPKGHEEVIRADLLAIDPTMVMGVDQLPNAVMAP